MRNIAKAQDGTDGNSLKPRVEGLFRRLEELDAELVRWDKDTNADARSQASAKLQEATTELASILAALDKGVMDRALSLV